MPMNVFALSWLFIPLLMTVLGGTGTIIGPWIGAIVVYAIAWYGDKYFTGWHPVILGVFMILVMLFLPAGIAGLSEKMPGRGSGGSAASQ
jgi:branched-chain amino acid transport system permease protein